MLLFDYYENGQGYFRQKKDQHKWLESTTSISRGYLNDLIVLYKY
ncbi:MAG: hypothetical protein ACI4XS_08120 [Bacillus sp. (in: firmicutes)]